MARVLKGSQFYLHTPHSSANGINHTYLCLLSQSWYSFTYPGGMEGWVGLGTWQQWRQSFPVAAPLSGTCFEPISTSICCGQWRDGL